LSPIMNRIYADTLVAARRYDEGIEQYKKTMELEPVILSHFFLARAYEAKGMYEEAATEYTKAAQTEGAGNISPKNIDYQKLGWRGFNQEALNRFLAASKKDYVPPFVIAAFYAKLGQSDEAIAWLEKGYQERDFRMTLIKVSFEFDSLHNDPRFKDLVRRIGLPE
ncbi:MAG TPA: tetratricopeptide repeat protein, partial [Pyrinomonadaceae bacterium]|nr:tetratricopeptide repeat protein [Pyrinomonadaceae bacterium]